MNCASNKGLVKMNVLKLD